MRGKLLVIYGANNLGKTTQAALLEKALQKMGLPTQRIKYPIYALEPTGPLINAVLREGKEMLEDKLQQIYIQNRRDYEPTLKKTLESGTSVIAEDYIGTGIAWGLVRGLDLETQEKWNSGLLPEDVAIILEGKRFASGREAGHRNETDDVIWQKARAAHDLLAERYGWKRVNANQIREKVHDDIMVIVKKEFDKHI